MTIIISKGRRDKLVAAVAGVFDAAKNSKMTPNDCFMAVCDVLGLDYTAVSVEEFSALSAWPPRANWSFKDRKVSLYTEEQMRKTDVIYGVEKLTWTEVKEVHYHDCT